jgi:hypothetical protein
MSAVLAILVAGCSVSVAAPAKPTTTCAEWLTMLAGPQTDLATSIVEREGLLENVRAAQHEGPATSKASLIQDVVGSITKDCPGMGQPDRLVVDLALRLYGGGRASDGYFGNSGAPTPQREPPSPTP